MFSIQDMIRGKVLEILSGLCDGPAEVGDLGLKVSGLVSLKDVSLSDSDGNKWLRAGLLKIQLGNWPSLSPTLTMIEADRIALSVTSRDGKLSLPLRRPSGRSGGSNAVGGLTGVRITNGRITVADTGGSEAVYDGLTFSLARNDGSYEFSLKGPADGDARALSLEGRIVPKTLDIELSLNLKHTPEPAESQVIRAVLGRLGDLLKGPGDAKA